ncbi:rRNA maturation RNase YbeY [Marivirga harenae]|uniref:rRNA maturation RNase YbeY n=1 Tax=Marivirga harenae TaxID=2010992 RepID=UPI0026DFB87A|nr:rRNA maturation RNase YbeY [Marivirga harenae]WKV13278.1 rRNA maturation RNase YbeY [Marivirga harenae]
MTNIYFFKEDYNIDLRTLQKHKKWLNNVAKSYEHKISELNYIFCSDEYLLKINLEYLNHDTYTDIITFDLNDYSEEQNTVEADIFISMERIKANSASFKTKQEIELARVMAHGLLHIIGFKDKTEEQKKEMRIAENKAIELL